MYRWHNRGLGAAGIVDSATGAINCSALVPGAESTNCGNCSGYFDWLVTPECWSSPPGAWSQAAQYPVPSLPVAVPAIPSAYGTGPSSVEDAQAQTDAAIATQVQAQQGQNAAFFGNVVPVTDSSGGACTSTLISNLCDSTVYIVGGIAAVVLALLAFGGRR